MGRRKRTEVTGIPEGMQYQPIEEYMAQGMSLHEAIAEHVWSMPRPVTERLGLIDHPMSKRQAMWRAAYPKKET